MKLSDYLKGNVGHVIHLVLALGALGIQHLSTVMLPSHFEFLVQHVQTLVLTLVLFVILPAAIRTPILALWLSHP